jgi:hypothetical protein
VDALEHAADLAEVGLRRGQRAEGAELHAAAGLGNRVSSSRYLHDLADAGLVAKTKAGKEILFVNERLVELLAN